DENGFCVSEVAVDSKSNEITAIPKLLDTMDIKSTIVTIDAMGTVVILNKVTKSVMIYCRKVQLQEEDILKSFDYVACLFPEGYILEAHSFFFDHSEINKVLHMGLVNEDEKQFKLELLKA
ncbi:MAG: DUF4176 domain-containing protein, partial [Defluviitaleaceae bacterium]|nr:DUF4176 domain-containing protein [Defluviitaleaceae bacterium]